MNTRGELARTSSRAFAYTKLGEVSIPDGVKELGDGCFLLCMRLSHVNFSASGCLERIGRPAFQETNLSDVTRQRERTG